MARDRILTNDRQLACARIQSVEGQDYLKAMASAANFAWVNRSSMTFLTRQVRAFARVSLWLCGCAYCPPCLSAACPHVVFRTCACLTYFLLHCACALPFSLLSRRRLGRYLTPPQMTWTCTSFTTCPTTSLRSGACLSPSLLVCPRTVRCLLRRLRSIWWMGAPWIC